MKKTNNRGFSLVELIIVIAIMAILVGVMAPQLIKYIEKANVSADVQLCDSIHSAIAVALGDPAVVTDSDAMNQKVVKAFQSGGGLHGPLGGLATYVGGSINNTAFYKEVVSSLGYDPFVTANTRAFMKSTPAKTSGTISFATYSNGNGFYIYISGSDKYGEKNNYTVPTGNYDNMDKVICAPLYDPNLN